MSYKKLMICIISSLFLYASCLKWFQKTIPFEEQKEIAEETVVIYRHYLDSLGSEKQARLLLIEKLRKTKGIISAGLSSDSTTIWWKIKGGIETCLLTVTKASLTDTTDKAKSSSLSCGFNQQVHVMPQILNNRHLPHNNNALILSPYAWDWRLLGLIPLEDETGFINNILTTVNYNTIYKVNANKDDQNITMNDYMHFDNFGVIVISSHGGVTSDNNVFIATGVKATSDLYEQYKQDLKDKNLVFAVFVDKWFTNKDIFTFAITPRWITTHYPQKLTNTLFYASVCDGLFNTTLATTITGTGSTYFSWTNSVNVPTCTKTGKDLFTQLVSNALTCGEAQIRVINNGNGVYNPLFGQTAYFRYYGDTNLCLVERPLRIAVTPAFWDDIGALLTGFGYNVTTIQLQDLLNYSVISQYDIIGINCAPDLGYYAQGAAQNLREFVTNGGRLYASDWAYVFIEAAFPEYIEFPSYPYSGIAQTVDASVIDNELANYLGVNQVSVRYDLSEWVIIDGVGPLTNILLIGNVINNPSLGKQPLERRSFIKTPYPSITVRPLAVSFNYGQGTVVYTTFHNEAQISEPVRHILEYFTILHGGNTIQ